MSSSHEQIPFVFDNGLLKKTAKQTKQKNSSYLRDLRREVGAVQWSPSCNYYVFSFTFFFFFENRLTFMSFSSTSLRLWC